MDHKTQTENVIPSHRGPAFSNAGEIEVVIAPNAGACFGVVRAVKLGHLAANRGLKTSSPVFALGALVHNPPTIKALEESGVKIVDEASAITGGTAILRSHGVRQEIEKDLRDRGIGIVDATCPLVKKPQRIAQGLAQKGYFLVLVGDANHPEVKGVLSYFGEDHYLVTYLAEDIEKIPAHVTKVGILAQTTIEASAFERVAQKCREKFQDVAVYNTICDATSIRQSEAELLSKEADIMVVVGGKASSNTSKLVKICKRNQPNTYLVETMEELSPDWFLGKRKIGVTGGAATPQEYVDEVGESIARLLS